MTKSFGAAAMAVGLMLGGSASAQTPGISSAATRQAQAAEISAISSRHHRKYRDHSAARPYYPSYYGRPVYYAPAPFFPLPPLFGYGWEPW
jgi:hypothetical protein